MSHNSLAILLIFFNRPDVFRRQLIALRGFRPPFIYFAADGPRLSNKEDLKKLNQCKELISQMIDWECCLQFYYSEKNYGCDRFVPMAINWFFINVESGIILEDDCLISREFYFFASYLLKKYAADERVMNISASNFQKEKWGDGDYYFSHYPANWGWATWRRAWRHYDPIMQKLDIFIGSDGLFNRMKLEREERRYWLKFFRGLQKGKYTFWDAKWLYSIWSQGGVSITPNFNLSSNIGHGESATHTKERLQTHCLSIHSLQEEIRCPSSLDVQAIADHHLFLNFYKPSFRGLLKAAINKLKKFA